MVDEVETSCLSIFNFEFRHQLFATLVVQILATSHGIQIGWVSPTLLALQSVDTPQSFSVSVKEASWIGSVYGLGSVSGAILFGFIERIGRKWSLLLLAVPQLLFWILVYVAPTVEVLYVARVMHGLTAGGIYVVVPIYLSEIADCRIRGALCSMPMIFIGLGILLGFIMASHLNYYLMPCIVLALPCIFILASLLLPETPQFLLRANKIEQAEKSLKFYKNIQREAIHAPVEAQKLNREFEELSPVILKGTEAPKATLKCFFTKSALKAYLTAVVVIILLQFSGSYALLNYMSDIFALSGTTTDPNTCTIISGVFQLIGSCLTPLFIDRNGRKPLLLYSAGGLALSLIVYGLFIQFATTEALTTYNWVPIGIMSIVMLLASAGVIPIIMVSIVEILPLKIRATTTPIFMGLFSLLMFVSLKMLPLLLHGIGVSFTMYVLAACCIVCITYLVIFLQETKGKPMDVE